ncbi:tyrosine--tRNA ligase, partial [Candidatus Saccharibacteria bacterium]|nr:tyrosine--tRNA ligase [Candidatus Saccharibacteria bacterium]
RVTGDVTHVWSTPLVINKATGKKFGKSEDGAVWLDPAKTTPTQFYQFWINVDDAGVEDYLKIFTMLPSELIDSIVTAHKNRPQERLAQKRLAEEVTRLVHGEDKMHAAEKVTSILVGKQSIADAAPLMDELRQEIPVVQGSKAGSIIAVLVATGLATSNTEARRLIKGDAIAINGAKVQREDFEAGDFLGGRALLRRGKAFKDSAIVELG